MDENLRKILSEPFGPVLSSKDAVMKIMEQRHPLLICIGDESLHKMLSYGIMPDICVYDKMVKRKSAPKEWIEEIEKAFKGKKIIKVKNLAGEITDKLIVDIKNCIKNKKGIIEVEGEEDLAALPSLANAPAGTLILYGQPDAGIVFLEVNEKGKKRAEELLEKIKKAN
ncbi:hypothetical protein COU37_04175 [Candidatus Micrarchaeota archaeon CG10_big_fil_rev_8_21_14_0_10_45_29]|nr:MAG: hypothetical protein COU37_04175 [Candidatus Micrarchaeota archaeon CG10_big_fil_rev_8_21_14_0_10_45_29]